MSKKLAIKGHSTRGKEVIALLEMLYGENHLIASGYEQFNLYYINNKGVINYKHHSLNKDMIVFTLEEFWEKFPFKVGDKVIDKVDGCHGIVTEIKWDEDVSDMKYHVVFDNGIDFGWFTNDSIEKSVKDMKKDNTALKPEKIESNAIKMVDGKVVDGLEKIHKLGPKSKLSPQYYEDNKNEFEEADIPKAPILSNREDYAEGKFGYVIPNGYEFDSIRNNQIIIRPIKSKYPKTYKECCEVLSLPLYYNLTYYTYERGYTEFTNNTKLCLLEDKLNTLGKLLICCEAYWKIAGEEMGLGKPWDPTYGCGEWGYWFGYSINENKIYLQDSRILVNHTLVFPTKEMRDAFYENFKDLIEQCKELL